MSTPINIVRLDGVHCPSLNFNIPHTYTEHTNTPFDPAIISSRLHNADVAITSVIPITETVLTACPKLKLIACFGIGTNHVDLAACKAHHITVCNIPGGSNEAVSEHAIALFFALRRNVLKMHDVTVQAVEWAKTGSTKGEFGDMPGTCKEETMAILGAGELGNRVATIGKALGMKVILAERKGVNQESIRNGRVPFEEALRTATVFMVTATLQPETRNLISASEFSLMRPDAIIINVARGGIVNEPDLVQALKARKIAGAATDVFVEEPAGKDNVLIQAANEEWTKGKLVLSPHMAWYARSTTDRMRRMCPENVEAWVRGEPRNLVI